MATQQLLLVKDVEHLGRSGDIVRVKAGYARNKLIPSKVALLADSKSIRLQAKLQEERKQKAIVDRSEAEAFAARIQGQTIRTTVKVDHDGHMYGSVSVSDIVRLVQEQLSITLEKRSVQLKHPIKTLGVTDIELKLQEGVNATFHLKILAEGAIEEPSPAAVEE
jgi:large subunit ribosomal protein L9